MLSGNLCRERVLRSRQIFFTLLLIAALFSAAPASAANNSFPVQVEAEVPSQLALQLTVVDAQSGQPIDEMDFGDLLREPDEFRSARSFHIQLAVQANGSPYQLKQQASALSLEGGEGEIPSGAILVTPSYLPSENEGKPLPAEALLAAAGPASDARTLFSDPSGTSRVLSMVYSVEQVPVDQPAGTYSGTLQFTLTTT